MDSEQRAAWAELGYIVVPGALPPRLLRELNDMLDTHVEAWRAEVAAGTDVELQPEELRANQYGDEQGWDDPHAGWEKTTPNGSWVKRVETTNDVREGVWDGQRWAPARGLPVDPAWSGPFAELLELPAVHAVLSEVLGEERWGNVLPGVPPEKRPLCEPCSPPPLPAPQSLRL